ncbi:GNAT family N-acetyltransferase [Actinocatenispora rupis]|uniref:GNAT family N-acetyltransferase n=1 Tax=Actinocatenispora rupis TaxID=519421 RepID=A0A8J3JC00_9ACTN|nr:GNAT family N-acetyltransferase [Actinocatenispora rupis]
MDSWLAVREAAAAADTPDMPPECREDVVGGLRVPWPAERARRWVAESDGRVVATMILSFQEVDNLDNVELDLVVHPGFRRRGIGTALHDLAVREARAAGCRRLMSESVRALPGGPASDGAGSLFARTTGATLAQTEVRRRLDVSTVDRTGLAARIAALTTDAAGYTLLGWCGAAPDDTVEGLAALQSRFLSEAPLGDLAWEPQQVDVARRRAGERSFAARGRVRYETVARHDATGEIVAWTDVNRYHRPADVWFQDITLVLPEHRGHRLGLLVKLANLAQVLDGEPAVAVHTWNAEENAHMIAINEEMGFRAVDAWDAWQLDLGEPAGRAGTG